MQADTVGIVGENFDSAALRALHIAKSNTSKVATLEFNGVMIGIDASVESESDTRIIARARDFYFAELERRRKEWEASPEGIAYREERQRQVATDCTKMGALMDQLEAFVSPTPEEVIRWVREMASINDDMDVAATFLGWKTIAARKLASLPNGYRANAGVGNPDVKEMRDSNAVEQWIVGQAINCMDEAMPIHPIAVKFCDQWLEKWGAH